MPVHWYYNLDILKEDFGELTYYADPKEFHPTTKFICLPKTDDPTVDIVGKVVLHSKRELYKKEGTHYHAELKAGDVTVNSDILRVLCETITKNKDAKDSYDPDKFLEEYVKFLTTPGSHNDTYIDTCHTNFIINYLRKKPLRECRGAENKDTACALCMKFVTPVLFAPLLDYFRREKVKLDDVVKVPEEVYEKCIKESLLHLGLLYDGTTIQVHTESYCRTLLNIVLGKDLRKAIEEDGDKCYNFDFPKLLSEKKDDLAMAFSKFHIACYTDGSLPLAYYLAYKYVDDFDKAIIVNCNLGGENLSRGGIVGGLIAAFQENLKMDSKWITGLNRREAFSKVFEEFLAI
jgi:ADP-ribosylglycohydrolase